MTRKRTYTAIVIGITLALISMPGTAFASEDSYKLGIPDWDGSAASQSLATDGETNTRACVAGLLDSVNEGLESAVAQLEEQAREAEKANKTLAYDPAAIAAIGTQAQSGHGVCCPSYSCAYADAVLDGTVHDHDYYVCSCCMWTDWGGGDSSYRCVGSDEQLLREAYDQIAAGRPTVIHVSWSGGEHWIALIGYENVTDPNHLSLSNFIALDPWDGAQLNAGSKYALYGDGCEHVSDR